ncbi:MAG: cob(I)yrinic acid a,c-diamide adenosyltransferase [Candidatus Microthrix parvicella]
MNDQDPTDVPTADPRPAKLTRATSLVLVNTGPGKGKTSAAIGVVIRGVARGWRVAVVQFLKSDTWHSGEEKVCRQLGVDCLTEGEGFTWDSTDLTVDRARAVSAWGQVKALISAGDHSLVVLDEVTYPVNWEWIDVGDVVETIRTRPDHVNLVITGRDAPQALIDLADTVTEMAETKHAYQAGISAKKGIDF